MRVTSEDIWCNLLLVPEYGVAGSQIRISLDTERPLAA